jgi:cholesterol transport system auxiliary component
MVARRRLLTTASGLAVASVFGLPGCAPLPGLSEPPDLYTLTPKSTFPDNLPQVEWQLLVEPAVASAALDTVRIALRRELTRIEYYAGVAWTERAPLMVQTLLVESFENSDAIVSVGRETFGLRADYVLKTELREFQAEYLDENAPPQVRAQINAKLVRMPDRQIVDGRTFESLTPADSRQFSDVILAFDAALGSVLKDAVEWTLRRGATDWRSRGN